MLDLPRDRVNHVIVKLDASASDDQDEKLIQTNTNRDGSSCAESDINANPFTKIVERVLRSTPPRDPESYKC